VTSAGAGGGLTVTDSRRPAHSRRHAGVIGPTC
jgi:hypothetical protein